MGRIFGTPYKDDAAYIQFLRTMEREGKSCLTYSDRKEFYCFFRMKNDNENRKETIIMYYDTTAPLRVGCLIDYNSAIFLTLNRETIENDIYYKSVLVQCNGTMNISGKPDCSNIPIYSEEIKSAMALSGTTFSIINGTSEIITEDNQTTQQIKIGDVFEEFGRTFEITNIYFMNGIAHIIVQVTQDRHIEQNYTLQIMNSPTKSFSPGETYQLSAKAFLNGTEVEHAVLTWGSSDEIVATVTSNGLITFLESGIVCFTATWKEQKISDVSEAVICGQPEASLSCRVTGDQQLSWGEEYESTFKNLDFDVTSDVEHIVWEIRNYTGKNHENDLLLKFVGKDAYIEVIDANAVFKEFDLSVSGSYRDTFAEGSLHITIGQFI